MTVRTLGATASAPWLTPWLALSVSLGACGSAAQPPAGADDPRSAAARASDEDEVVAVVNGTPITRAELDGDLVVRLAEIEAQAYELRQARLDALIAERLMAAEAERRGISAAALEAEEIDAKTEPVTDEEVEAIFEANRNRAPDDPEGLKAFIRERLDAQKREERRAAFADDLKAASDVEVHLAPPDPPRARLDHDGAPSRGPEDAAVTIVEFSDYHCPFCRRVQATLAEIRTQYGGQVRQVFRHFPIDQLHPTARKASEAAWCAEQQGRFWEYHDRLFAAGTDASGAALKAIATEVGLDEAAFDACTASDEARDAVARDVEEAARLGLSATPTFFINGRPLIGGRPLEAFIEVIDEELDRP